MTLLTGSGDGGNSGSQTSSSQGSTTTTTGSTGSTTGSGQGSGAGSGSGGSGSAADWKASLPEDIRSHGALAQIQDIQSLAKSYVHAQSVIGKKGVFVPGEKATDEEWQGFYKSIGVPEADKYEVAVPNGIPVNQDAIKGFKEAALKAGLLPRQAQALLDWEVSREKTMQEQTAQQKANEQKQGLADLQKEWGAGYDKNISLAKTAVEQIGGKTWQQFLERTGLGNDPVVIKTMAEFGKLLGEDKIRGGGDAGKFGGQTPQEIQGKISSIMADGKHPYFDPSHPSHRSAVMEMEGLYKSLYGGAAS